MPLVNKGKIYSAIRDGRTLNASSIECRISAKQTSLVNLHVVMMSFVMN